MKHLTVASLTLALTLPTNLSAEEFLTEGKCELIVASRQTLSEAQAYVRVNYPTKQFARVFLSQNGWYAISVGSLWPNEEEKVMRSWKRSGHIPQDSLCSSGASYVQAYDPSTGQIWSNQTASVTRPVIKQPVIQSQKERPKACQNPESFCKQLSFKAAACGWLGQAAADEALSTETGAVGGAVSGASCHAILLSASGLDIDIYDLAIAATSSAFIDGAGQSLSDGNLLDALFQGVAGAAMSVVGLAKCEADLEVACR